MRSVLLALPIVVAVSSSANAQAMVDVPIWGNGILSQQALRSTFDHYDETHGLDRDERRDVSRACSADALPAADRRRLEGEYIRRAKADGRPSANAWVREQGLRFRQRLIAQGVCPEVQR